MLTADAVELVRCQGGVGARGLRLAGFSANTSGRAALRNLSCAFGMPVFRHSDTDGG